MNPPMSAASPVCTIPRVLMFSAFCVAGSKAAKVGVFRPEAKVVRTPSGVKRKTVLKPKETSKKLPAPSSARPKAPLSCEAKTVRAP